MKRERPARGQSSTMLARTAWNGLGPTSTLGAQLVLTPFLLHRLGLDRYGIWALIGVIVTFVSATDGGLGASLTYFFALHRGSRDTAASSRLAGTAVLIFALLGGVITLVIGAATPYLVAMTKVPPSFRDEALSLRFLIGPLVLAGFLFSVFSAMLQAHDRFRTIGLISVVRVTSVVVGSVLGIEMGGGLRALLLVNAGSLLAAAILAAVACRPHVAWKEVGLLRVAERKALWSYGSRMQLSNITALVTLELDALIVGVVLSVRYVGIYSIGANVALAAKTFPMYLLGPLFTRLALRYSEAGLEGVAAVYRRVNPLWIAGILTYDAAGVVGLYFGVQAWLGPGNGTTAAVAALIFVGHGINLLTGVASALARAIGRPGLETRYALWSTAINLGLTIPFGVMFGLFGVVGSTVVGTVLGSVYFFRILRRSVETDLGCAFAELRPVLTGGATLLAVIGELLVSASGRTGISALGLAVVPAGVALTMYLWCSRPRFAAIEL